MTMFVKSCFISLFVCALVGTLAQNLQFPFLHAAPMSTMQFQPQVLHRPFQFTAHHPMHTMQFGPFPPGFGNPFQPNPGPGGNPNNNLGAVNNGFVATTGATNTVNNGATSAALPTGDTVDGLASSLSLIVGRLSALSNDPSFLSGLPNPPGVLPGANGNAAANTNNILPGPNTNINTTPANTELASINEQLRDILTRLGGTTSTPQPSTTTHPATTAVTVPVGNSVERTSLTPTPRDASQPPLNPVVTSTVPTTDLSSSIVNLSSAISRNLNTNRN